MKITRCKDCGQKRPGPRMDLSCEHNFETVEVFTDKELRERLDHLIAEHKRTNVQPRRRDRDLYKGVASIFEEADGG